MRLSADLDAYTLQGNNADFVKTTPQRSVDAAEGAYSVTGVAAGLYYDPVAGGSISLPAVRGIYAMTGRDATLTTGTTTATDISTLTLSGSGSVPFTCGYAFRQGDVPSDQAITASISTFQADIRNRWPDGSVRFAVLSGISTSGTITVRSGGTPYSAGNVAEPSTAAVVAFTSVVDASASAVAGGSFSADIATARTAGAGAWSRTQARKVREILGPVMSEFHYFVPTSDAHTHVWFYVRAYSSGAVEVETMVENGWLNVASPGRRNYNVTVTIAGTQRYSGSVVHYHHTRWGRVDWAGTDPASVAIPNAAYMQRSNLVPTQGVTTLPSTTYANFPETGTTKFNSYTAAVAYRSAPFSLYNHDPDMGAGGDNEAYGVVPAWGSTFLVEGNTGAFWASVGNGRGTMRWCLHYRDEATGLPVSSFATGFGINDTNSNMSLVGSQTTTTPAPSGGVPSGNNWTFTHSPGAAFMAYLIDGRWTMLEEQQFQAGCGALATVTSYAGGRAMAWFDQNRGQGARFRDRAQQVLITPEYLRGSAVSGADATQLANVNALLTTAINEYYDYYIAGSSTSAPTVSRGNPFGLPFQNADFDFFSVNNDGTWGYGGLQTGLYIFPILYAFDADPNLAPATGAKLAALAAFHAKFPVGMLGAATNGSNWNWRISSFVTLGFGTPGALTSGGDANEATQTYYANWDANWTAIQTAPAYVWQAGTDFNPSDNYLRKINAASSSALRISTLTAVTDDTDTRALWWVAVYAHKIADRVSVPGIETAITRLLESDTWKNTKAARALQRPDYAITSDRYLPAWVPSTVGAAAKLAATNSLDDVDLTGVWSGDSAAHFGSYSGGAYNPYIGTWGAHVIHGGGHSASNDNSVFLFDYNDLTYKLVGAPTQLASDADYEAAITTAPNTVANPREVASGVPGSAHTYGCLNILSPALSDDAKGALIRPVAGAIGRAASRDTGWAHVFKFTTNTWERWSTNNAGAWSPGGSTCFDTTRNKIWPINSETMAVVPSLDLASKTWTNLSQSYPGLGTNAYPDTVLSAYHAQRDIVVISTCRDGGGAGQSFFWFDASSNGTARNAVTFSSGTLPDARFGGGSLVYVPELQKLIYWTRQNVDTYYEIDVPATPASSWTWTAKTITGAGRISLLPNPPGTETFGRMDYAPQLKSLVFIARRPLSDFRFGNQVVCIRVVP